MFFGARGALLQDPWPTMMIVSRCFVDTSGTFCAECIGQEPCELLSDRQVHDVCAAHEPVGPPVIDDHRMSSREMDNRSAAGAGTPMFYFMRVYEIVGKVRR